MVFPLAATLYIIVSTVTWTNNTMNELLFEWWNVDIPGLGILTVFFLISFLGYLLSRAFIRPIVQYFERLLNKVPLVKILYASLKELTEAFVGDKKRFNKPVLVRMGDLEVQRIGFLVQTELDELGLKEQVAVYCPHSYNVSGNLYLVPSDAVTPLQANSAEIMRYVVSGGITRLEK